MYNNYDFIMKINKYIRHKIMFAWEVKKNIIHFIFRLSYELSVELWVMVTVKFQLWSMENPFVA